MDRFLHQPIGDLNCRRSGVAPLHPASGVSQKLNPFLVRHSNADGVQYLQTGSMNLFDLLLCQEPVTGYTLSFETTVHDVYLLEFAF